jgi:hypothetical protein
MGFLRKAIDLKAADTERTREVEENTERTHLAITGRTQSELEENTERSRFTVYRKTELVTFSIRLAPDDKRRLKEYFDRRRVPLSAGIRGILCEFLDENAPE